MTATRNHRPNAQGTTLATKALRPGLILAGILLLAANMRAPLTVVTPLLGRIQEDTGLASSVSSALIALPVLCFAAVSPLAPKFAARWGIERTLAAAVVVLIAGIVLRSSPWSATPWMPGLWLGTVGIGAGIACLNVLLPALLKRDFPQRVGPMTGVYNAVMSGFAGLAAGFAVPLASLPGWDWRTALGVCAALALVALGVFLPQLRGSRGHRVLSSAAVDDASSASRSTLPSRSAGVVTSGSAAGSGADPAADPEADPVAAPAAGAPLAPSGRRRSVWSQATAWQVSAFMGLQSCLFYTIVTWWPAVERDGGVSELDAGAHMAVLQLFGIVANLAAGSLLKRVGERLVTVIPVTLTFTGILGQMLAPDFALLWVALLGLGTGGNIVAALALFGARTRDHRDAAALSGMAQSMGYIIAAFAPPLLGALHDASGAWTLPLSILLGINAAAGLAGVLATRKRWVSTRPDAASA